MFRQFFLLTVHLANGVISSLMHFCIQATISKFYRQHNMNCGSPYPLKYQCVQTFGSEKLLFTKNHQQSGLKNYKYCILLPPARHEHNVNVTLPVLRIVPSPRAVQKSCNYGPTCSNNLHHSILYFHSL